mmetsp:Transcript_7508/g.12485  ORF Transcript_7508/g.12485 Transcript_7508/m.12485 type:complete len:210 (+) Transcript_7508:130-759(+)|eukprot:CAMPEP_0174958920 /NCGR_PEP_ID=MMETSP0004_2-20121128/2893_1 /TAXON_ID=420556 /ORGANISM="Ochromonas sp., Strain CCMP1393" /LENGTH=209 /DNA_ID=CAMNT_0016207189 /DNA_START=103 /DNA_END=732 /DNA_ORIENTATION=-
MLGSFAAAALLLSIVFSIQLHTSAYRVGIHQRGMQSSRLHGKISKTEETPGKGKVDDKEEDGMMTLPHSGLVGYEPNNLFYEPVETQDPLKDTSDLPGEDGSDEKIAAIQQRIQERVEALKAKGEWDDTQEFGTDPLSRQPIWQTMAMQVKACRPFESVDDLLLTYILVIVSTLSISAYLVFLRESLDSIVSWYVNTDFDTDFFSGLGK